MHLVYSRLIKLKKRHEQNAMRLIDEKNHQQRQLQEQLQHLKHEIVHNERSKADYIRNFHANLRHQFVAVQIMFQLETAIKKFHATHAELIARKDQFTHELHLITAELGRLKIKRLHLLKQQEKYHHLLSAGNTNAHR